MINKRIFGADIPILVKKKLEARQKVATGGKLPGDSINSRYKDETSEGSATYNYEDLITSDFEMEADLSSRTSFARMWTAVALVRPIDVDMDDISSDDYDKLTEDEKKGYKLITHKIYAVGTNNLSTVDNINNPNESMDDVSELNYAIFPNELGTKKINDIAIEGNKFLKPQAGITGVSSETGGTLGSVKTTEIKFIVHNFTDYDQIYNKYFLRPGAQIFVDFGWSSLKKPLYNPSDLLDDADGVGVETKLYGEKQKGDSKEDGYITEQAGDQETLIGIVTGYDSKITENGSVECSITLTSKNTALNLSPKLPTEDVETTNAKFEFELDNLIKFEALYKLADKDTRENMMEALGKANSASATKEKAAFDSYITELAVSSFGTVSNYNPTTLAMESGVFLVGDDANSTDQYISWGLLEDRILNKYFGHGDSLESISSDKKEKYEIGLDSSKSFTTYHKSFNLTQRSIKTAPVFVVPTYWDKTWQNDLKTGGKSGKTIEERKQDFINNGITDFDSKISTVQSQLEAFIGNIKYTDDSTKYFGDETPLTDTTPISKFDAERFRVPLREIFVNVDVIKRAFTNENNNSFKAVVNEILDEINSESYGIWDWVLASDGDSSRLSIIDKGQLGIAESQEENKFDKIFTFNVMGKNSIVKGYDVSFEMPDNEIGSMYAIQAMSGTSKKLYPISTLIEEQATLQSLLSKVGEENGKLRFRYLPDIGTHNGEQLNSDADESTKFTSMYQTAASVISEKYTDSSYGHPFDSADIFQSVMTGENEQLTEEELDAIDSETIQANKEFNLSEGYKYRTPEERRRAAIVGAYEAENLPRPMPFPMKLTLNIYGISTLKPGDIFKVDYLPEVYLERVYFQVLKVSHTISPDGWYTELETQFRIKPEEVDNPIIVKAPVKDTATSGELNVPVGKDNNGKTITQKEKYNINEHFDENNKKLDIVNVEEETNFQNINDSNFYKYKSSAIGMTTWAKDLEKQTWHMPTSGNLKDGGWSLVYYKDIINNTTQTFADGAKVLKNEKFKYILNFEMLKPHFLTVWDKSEDLPRPFKNLDFLYEVTLRVSAPYRGIIISNPMYAWLNGWNRLNGYGYGPNFNSKGSRDSSQWSMSVHNKYVHTHSGKAGVVRGIYRHGEKVWFGGRNNSGGGYSDNTHWFVMPTGRYDERQSVQDTALESVTSSFNLAGLYGDGSKGLSLINVLALADRYKGCSFDNDWDFDKFTGESEQETVNRT